MPIAPIPIAVGHRFRNEVVHLFRTHVGHSFRSQRKSGQLRTGIGGQHGRNPHPTVGIESEGPVSADTSPGAGWGDSGLSPSTLIVWYLVELRAYAKTSPVIAARIRP